MSSASAVRQAVRVRLRRVNGLAALFVCGDEHSKSEYVQLVGRDGCCAGIYGPGRSALDTVKQRDQSKSQQRRTRKRYTARCHVHDIWQAVHASMCSQAGDIDVLNVVDDDPAPRCVASCPVCLSRGASWPRYRIQCRMS